MTTPPGVEQRIKKQREQPKVHCQMKMEVDRISNLPGNIIDKILSFLPLRYAVRSSILSRKWRYNWRNLTSLVFDYESIIVSILRVFTEDTPILVHKAVKIVDHVLLLHNGPIHKFKLAHPKFQGVSCDIDQWILFLSRGSLKEFILDVWDPKHYKLPSSFYLCDKLSYLKLGNCWLEPLSSFNGYKILTRLHLSSMRMGQDVLENLIYSCPLLERLTLMDFYSYLDHLKIHAPKLTFFDIHGVFEDVNFVNSVHLSTVSICFSGDDDDDDDDSELPLRNMSTLIKFFASLPSIQRLHVDSHFLGIRAGDTVPRRLPTPCIYLNYLSLHINFKDMDECVIALCILRSSPNLKELEITSPYASKWLVPREVTKNLMELEDFQISCFFNRLRLVQIRDIFGVPRELNFIEFLLAKSPMLERMIVQPTFQESGMKLVKELLRLRRASSHAEIIYLGR